MRKVSIYLAISALALAIVADTQAASRDGANGGANRGDVLKLNRVYRSVIRLELPSGSTQIPLPPGAWVLLGLDRPRHRKSGIPFVIGSLVKLEAGVLAGIVQFRLNTEPSRGGWPAQSFCATPTPLFMETRANSAYRNVDCWGLGRRQLLVGRQRRKDARAMIKELTSRGIAVPAVMISAEFRKTDRRKLLSLSYLFDPGQSQPITGPISATTTRSGIRDWDGPNVRRDKQKSALVEKIKSWGWSWRLHVEAGFKGLLAPAR